MLRPRATSAPTRGSAPASSSPKCEWRRGWNGGGQRWHASSFLHAQPAPPCPDGASTSPPLPPPPPPPPCSTAVEDYENIEPLQCSGDLPAASAEDLEGKVTQLLWETVVSPTFRNETEGAFPEAFYCDDAPGFRRINITDVSGCVKTEVKKGRRRANFTAACERRPLHGAWSSRRPRASRLLPFLTCRRTASARWRRAAWSSGSARSKPASAASVSAGLASAACCAAVLTRHARPVHCTALHMSCPCTFLPHISPPPTTSRPDRKEWLHYAMRVGGGAGHGH